MGNTRSINISLHDIDNNDVIYNHVYRCIHVCIYISSVAVARSTSVSTAVYLIASGIIMSNMIILLLLLLLLLVVVVVVVVVVVLLL